MADQLLEYQIKVFAWLDGLKIGDIKNTLKVEDRDKFIATVKMYIDCTGRVEFSNDYKKIRVIETYDELIKREDIIKNL